MSTAIRSLYISIAHFSQMSDPYNHLVKKVMTLPFEKTLDQVEVNSKTISCDALEGNLTPVILHNQNHLFNLENIYAELNK